MTDKIDQDELDLEPIAEVSAVRSTKSPVMPTALAQQVANFTTLQKRYADFRSRGMKQADAAQKAGSKASDRAALGRVGYNFEQLEGMKEYISFLYEKRASASVVDEIELVEKLRAVIELGMDNGNLNACNKAIELMGLMIGAFKTQTKEVKQSNTQGKVKNNVNVFKDGDEESTPDDKLKAISSLMKSMGKEIR
jgi:hypothetical protein